MVWPIPTSETFLIANETKVDNSVSVLQVLHHIQDPFLSFVVMARKDLQLSSFCIR